MGIKFASETDTEVIPHLLDYYYREFGDFTQAFEKTLNDLRGAYAIAAISTFDPDKLFIARLSSPLVFGVGKQEFIVASDPTALMEHTKEVVFLQDDELAIVTPTAY